MERHGWRLLFYTEFSRQRGKLKDAAVPAGIDEMRRAGIGEFAVGKSRAEMAEGAVALG